MFVLALLILVAQASAQNPSPMSDSTRPHTRVERYDVPGRRAALSLGTLYLPPSFDPARPFTLIVHFHGAPWLVEHHVREKLPNAALVTVQVGSGARVYAEAFVDPERFGTLLADVSSRLAELNGKPAAWQSITLSSFSAGYGAIRSILKQPDDFRRVGAVILADSLHAPYDGDAATPRTTDRPVLKPGPIGMQQLSEATLGGLRVAGYAGNSAPDHMDHLYALGDLLACRPQP